MELTSAHLRYLLAIYEVSRTHLDISSRSIAEKLGVTKPSVVRIMNLLMERGMIVKEHYGKIYLTDRGIFVAREVQAQLDRILQNFPPVKLELTDEGAVFRTPTLQLTLHGGGAGAMQRHGNDVRGALTVRAGQTGGVVLESAAQGPPRTMAPQELLDLFVKED